MNRELSSPFFSIKSYLSFLNDLVGNRQILIELAKQDFKQRFSGNLLGVTWAFVNPLIQVSILWFVFSVGFRAQPVENIPYIYWLLAGFFPWLHLSETIISGTHCIIEKPYLVKKVVFRVSTLPIVKLISSSVIHFFFFLILLLVFSINGVGVLKYKIQLIYYGICLLFFSLTISWITSALIVFIRDIGQIISISVQFGFWLTPVFWNPEIIPPRFQFLLFINPANYIVTGYRDSLLGGRWFYERGAETFIFWSISITLLSVGIYIFKRLRLHFADVM